MGSPKYSFKHPRLPEFEDYKFNTDDIRRAPFRFITICDDNNFIILEYAHIIQNSCPICWCTPDGYNMKDGEVLKEIEQTCYLQPNHSIFIDIYVNDMYKRNPRLISKQIFRYQMTITRAYLSTQRKCGMQSRYTVKPVGCVDSFNNLSQVIKRI